MCEGTIHSIDWFAAANAADSLSGQVWKALDPMNDDDFVLIVARLARDLENLRRVEVAPAMRVALSKLDVNWGNLSSAARGRVISAANKAIANAEVRTLPVLRQELQKKTTSIVTGTRKAAQARVSTKLSVTLDKQDKKIIDSIARKDVFFRRASGFRSEAFTATGQKIIQGGLEKGLRISEITRDLVKAAKKAHFNRSEHYMRIVASQAVNSSRVYGELTSLRDARIYSYVFWAVMDERTTEECRLLHEVEFKVEDALNRYAEIAADPDPEACVRLKPFVRSSVNQETGKRELYVTDRNGDRQRIATVEQPGKGLRDTVGVYSDKASLPTMDALGISYPPLHELCRSTIIGT